MTHFSPNSSDHRTVQYLRKELEAATGKVRLLEQERAADDVFRQKSHEALRELGDELRDVLKENTSLQHTISQLESRLQTTSSPQSHSPCRNCTLLRSELSSLRSSMIKANSDQVSLTQDLNEATDIANRLRRDNRSLGAQLEALNEYIHKLEDEKVSFEYRIASYERDKAAMVGQIDELHSKISYFETREGQYEEEFARLNQSNSDLQSSLEETMLSLNDYKTTLVDYGEKIQHLADFNDQLVSEKEEIIAENEVKMEQLQKEVLRYQDQAMKAQKSERNALTRLAKLEVSSHKRFDNTNQAREMLQSIVSKIGSPKSYLTPKSAPNQSSQSRVMTSTPVFLQSQSKSFARSLNVNESMKVNDLEETDDVERLETASRVLNMLKSDNGASAVDKVKSENEELNQEGNGDGEQILIKEIYSTPIVGNSEDKDVQSSSDSEEEINENLDENLDGEADFTQQIIKKSDEPETAVNLDQNLVGEEKTKEQITENLEEEINLEEELNTNLNENVDVSQSCSSCEVSLHENLENENLEEQLNQSKNLLPPDMSSDSDTVEFLSDSEPEVQNLSNSVEKRSSNQSDTDTDSSVENTGPNFLCDTNSFQSNFQSNDLVFLGSKTTKSANSKSITDSDCVDDDGQTVNNQSNSQSQNLHVDIPNEKSPQIEGQNSEQSGQKASPRLDQNFEENDDIGEVYLVNDDEPPSQERLKSVLQETGMFGDFEEEIMDKQVENLEKEQLGDENLEKEGLDDENLEKEGLDDENLEKEGLDDENLEIGVSDPHPDLQNVDDDFDYDVNDPLDIIYTNEGAKSVRINNTTLDFESDSNDPKPEIFQDQIDQLSTQMAQAAQHVFHNGLTLLKLPFNGGSPGKRVVFFDDSLLFWTKKTARPAKVPLKSFVKYAEIEAIILGPSTPTSANFIKDRLLDVHLCVSLVISNRTVDFVARDASDFVSFIWTLSSLVPDDCRLPFGGYLFKGRLLWKMLSLKLKFLAIRHRSNIGKTLVKLSTKFQ
ncbi:hypothetical protein P9112_013796 [Eukaryota sp. TZLM1-RC]